MAEIDTYSPRKVTDQNKDRLPSTHDSSKRITYVNITLNEEEIAEAIRNWIRAQVPIEPNTEMPVEMIAGRGENGHSANVTVSLGPVSVESPTQPTEPMQEFSAAAEDARRRNEQEGVYDEPITEPAETVEEAPEVAETTEDSGPEPAEAEPEAAGQPEPETTTEKAPQEAAPEPDAGDSGDRGPAIGGITKTPQTVGDLPQQDTSPTPAPEQPTGPAKKSSLFDTPTTPSSNSVIADTSPQTPPTPAPSGARRSIFDD